MSRRSPPLAVVGVAALFVLAGCDAGSTGDPEPDAEPDPVGPTAIIEGAESGTAPLRLTLDASSSTAGDVPLAGYRWLLDGEEIGIDPVLERALLLEGDHYVELFVTDEAGLEGSATVTVSVGPEACPAFSAPAAGGSLNAAALEELSGLTASRRTPGVLWGHNDSGFGPYLFAFTESGELLAAFEVQGATAFDWEDMAWGPGPDPGLPYLYLGDVGDNAFVRDEVVIYRVPEPEFDVNAAEPVVSSTATAEVLRLAYPAGAENVEGLIVDPVDGSLYLFSKDSSTLSRVYRAPPMAAGGGLVTLENVATLDVNGAGFSTPLITAADVTPLGNQIAVRTYTHLFVWLRPGGAPLASAFTGTRCVLTAPSEMQGESVAFSTDGRRLFTASEGLGSTVFVLERTD